MISYESDKSDKSDFYISDKILSKIYIYDIIRKIQLTTNRCQSSCKTMFKKS